MPDALSFVEHFVVLMLENRSFDHMLGWLKQDDPQIDGLTGTESNPLLPADPSSPTVQVTNTAGFGDPDVDPGHDLLDVNEQLFGSRTVPAGASPTNLGFVANYAHKRQQSGKAQGSGANIMRCFAAARLPVLTALAREFALCDHWFSSVPGPTWPNRFFIHCGWSGGHYDNKFRFYGMRTVYEQLEAKKCTWRIYRHGSFGQSFLLTHLQDASRAENFQRIGDFYRAAAKGRLPHYSFIEPDYFGGDANDQHPPHDVRHGDALIARVYEAVRRSPAWERSLLLVTYDEHGGIYDHVAPPAGPQFIPNPKHDPDFDFSRLGVRVPAVIVSPYIPKGTVDHTVYDHTSVPATLTKRFGLPGRLSRRVAQANTFEQALSLAQPRSDTPETVMSPALAAARRAPSTLPLSDLQLALVEAAQNLEAVLLKGTKPAALGAMAAAAPAAARPLTRTQAGRYVNRVGAALLARAPRATAPQRPRARRRRK